MFDVESTFHDASSKLRKKRYQNFMNRLESYLKNLTSPQTYVKISTNNLELVSLTTRVYININVYPFLLT